VSLLVETSWKHVRANEKFPKSTTLVSKGLPPLEASHTVIDDTDANTSHSEELEPHGDDNTTTCQDNDEQVIANEIAMLQAERIKLHQQKRLKESIQLRDALKRECYSLKSSVAAEPSVSAKSEQATSFPWCPSFPAAQNTTSFPSVQDNSEHPTVKELRSIAQLSEDAEAQLTRYGIDYSSGEQTNPTNDITGKNAEILNNYVGGPYNYAPAIDNNKSVMSGREVRMRDTVVRQLIWPHTRLDFTYGSSDIMYSNLDPALLVAGELGVLLTVPEEERVARTKLLQRIMYFSKDYAWTAVRSFHEAVLLEVERGTRQ